MESEIKFRIHALTKPNQYVKVLGSIPELGNWNELHPLSLYTNEREYPFWKSIHSLRIPSGQKFEFKLAIYENNSLTDWENLPGNCNRKYGSTYARVRLEGAFGDFNGNEIIEKRYPSISNFEIKINPESIRKISFGMDFDPYKWAENSESDDNSSFTDFFISNSKSISDDAINSDGGMSEDAELTNLFDNHGHILQRPKNKEKNRSNPTNVKGIKRSNYLDNLNVNTNKGLVIDRAAQSPLQKYYLSLKEKSLLRSESLSPTPFTASSFDFSDSSLKPLFITICSFYLPIRYLEYENGDFEVTLNRKVFEMEVYQNLKKSGISFKWIGIMKDYIPKEKQKKVSEILLREWNLISIFMDYLELEQLECEFFENYLDSTLKFNECNQSKNAKSIFNYDEKTYSEIYDRILQEFATSAIKPSRGTVFILGYKLFLLPQMLTDMNDNIKLGFYWSTSFLDSTLLEKLPFKEEFIFSLLNCNMLVFNSFYEAKPLFSMLSNRFNIELQSFEGVLHFKYMNRIIIIRINKQVYDYRYIDLIKENEFFKRSLMEIENNFRNCDFIVSYEVNINDLIEKIKLAEYYFNNYKKRDEIFVKFILIVNEKKVKNKRLWESLIAGLDYRHFFIIPQKVLTDQDEFAILSQCKILIENQISEQTYYRVNQYNNLKKRGCVLFNNAYELWTKEVLNFKFELYDPTKPFDICQKIDKILMNEINYPNENIFVDENWIEDCMKDINLAKRISDYEKSVIISPNIFDGSKLSMNLKASIKSNMRRLNGDILHSSYNRSKNRVILFGFESTFIRKNDYIYVTDHLDQTTKPILKKPSDEILEFFEKIAKINGNTVYIITERGLDALGSFYLKIDRLGFANENGFLLKDPDSKSWVKLFDMNDWSWKDIVRKIMENNYASKTPGSYVEVRESCVRWKWEKAERELGKRQGKVLMEHLNEVLEKNSDIEVVRGEYMVEVRPIGMNKATFVNILLEKTYEDRGQIDFILAVAGSEEDNEIFEAIQDPQLKKKNIFKNVCDVYNCSIEERPCTADYWIENFEEIITIL